MQVDAARYANPLTMLPGNVPIDEHMERLLEAGVSFAVAYCDLNDFKAFNDAYGYRRGDEMIKLTARTLTAVCDQRCDFIGHIGGDDFILLLQTAEWEAQCLRALQIFEDEALFLFDASDRERGALVGEDRSGNRLTHPLTSLAIGVISVSADSYRSHLEVSGAAAVAKKQAKRAGGNALFVERRRPPGDADKPRADPDRNERGTGDELPAFAMPPVASAPLPPTPAPPQANETR
jgi:diguanylate cyclase (GGDEF)-like protein